MPVSRPRWPTGAKPPRIAIKFVENPQFLEGVKKSARMVMRDTAKAVKRQAKHNVAPGVGPGPHPHKPGSHHEDTGKLMRSVFYRTWEKKLEVGFMVGTPQDYGYWLEIGWYSSLGNFWRYPWLRPALMSAAPIELAVSTAKYKF